MVFCGLFRDCMKGNSSSMRDRTGDSQVKMVGINMRSKYSSELRSYESACKKDESLKSFDSSLHQRTNKIFRSLSAQANTQSLNLDSLMEVFGFLLELNEATVRVIIKSKEDVLKDKDLKSLVDVYFRSTSKTLDFCNTVEKCVKKTEISQLIIQLAVKQFEKETVDTDLGEGSKKKKFEKEIVGTDPDTDLGEGSKKKKYTKTLEELNKFKAMGNPFEGEYETQYNSVWEEQVSLLDELHKLNKKLGKKHRNLKTWRILSNAFFGVSFVSVLVLSVAAVAMGAPQILAAVASAMTMPLDYVGKWSNKMWKKYEEAVEKQINLVSSIEKQAKVNKFELENINAEVNNLSNKIEAIMDTVKIAVGRKEEEEATRLAMVRIKNQVDEFTKQIGEGGERAAKCRKHIMLGRVIVLGDFFFKFQQQ